MEFLQSSWKFKNFFIANKIDIKFKLLSKRERFKEIWKNYNQITL